VRVGALVAVLLAVAVAGPAAAAPRAGPVPVDQQAPDFTLGDQHGTPLRLSEAVRGRDFVVLAFYVKAFTGG
jgi:hypothetical protein